MKMRSYCAICQREHFLDLLPKAFQALTKATSKAIGSGGLVNAACEECHPFKYHLPYSEWKDDWQYFSERTGKFERWGDRIKEKAAI